MANRKLKTVLGALLLSSAVGLVGCGGGEERQAKYLERAQAYFDEGNMDKAKIEVKNVLQINPNNAEGRYYLALIAEADKDYRSAFGNLSAVIENDPNHVKALNKLTEYYLGGKDYDQASEKASKVLELDPKNADALANMAVILASREQTEEALLKAQEALAVDSGHVKAVSVLTAIYAKDNPDLALETITNGIANQSKNESLKLLKLRLLASQGKKQEVVELYNELIAEYPDKLFYSIQLVNYYLGDQDRSEDERKDLAEETLSKLVESKPEEAQPKLWLTEFLLKNRSREKGKEALVGFVKADRESSELTDLLAQIYLEDDEIEEAKKLYQPFINEDPTSVKSIEARNRLVTIAVRSDDLATVERLQKEIFDLEPENSAALLTRARLNLKDNNVDDAIPDLRVVLKNDPESKDALAMLAYAHEANGSQDLALDSYQRLLAVQPDNVAALVGAGKILIAKNETDAALPLLESAVKIDKTNPEVTKLLSDLYSREQRWDEALSTSAQLIENEDTKALGHYLQGRIYLRSKEFNKALKSLKASIELEPSGIETLSSISAAYIALEKVDEALEFVKAHSTKYPDQAHAKELLAGLYARQRDTDKAIAIGESLIAEHPDRVSAYTLLGRLYAATGQLDKIEAMYKEGISKNPETAILRISLAEVYQATGKFDLAIQQYEEVLKIKPDALVARNNLASLLMDYDDSPDTIQRVVELTGELAATENPAFLDTAGWAQYKLGNYAQAVSLLGAAVENGGNGPVFHYHLGMAYLKSDMKAQAKEHLQIALADDTANFVGKEEAQNILPTL